MKKLLTLCLFSALFTSCSDWSHCIDEALFVRMGGTLFSNPNVVSMKEIHLDNGALLGREVVIQGGVVKTGEHMTHLVLSDQSARMLVVLSRVPNADSLLQDEKLKNLRILGTVERGKKGLPLIMARVIAPADPKQS